MFTSKSKPGGEKSVEEASLSLSGKNEDDIASDHKASVDIGRTETTSADKWRRSEREWERELESEEERELERERKPSRRKGKER